MLAFFLSFETYTAILAKWHDYQGEKFTGSSGQLIQPRLLVSFTAQIRLHRRASIMRITPRLFQSSTPDLPGRQPHAMEESTNDDVLPKEKEDENVRGKQNDEGGRNIRPDPSLRGCR